jgi:hypothetical protein
MYYQYTPNPMVNLIVAYVLTWCIALLPFVLFYRYSKGILRSASLGIVVFLASIPFLQVNAFLFYQMDMPQVSMVFISFLLTGWPFYAGFIAILWDIYKERFSLTITESS